MRARYVEGWCLEVHWTKIRLGQRVRFCPSDDYAAHGVVARSEGTVVRLNHEANQPSGTALVDFTHLSVVTCLVPTVLLGVLPRFVPKLGDRVVVRRTGPDFLAGRTGRVWDEMASDGLVTVRWDGDSPFDLDASGMIDIWELDPLPVEDPLPTFEDQ